MINSRHSFITLLITIAMALLCCEAIEKYSDKYDYIDVDQILASPKQRNNYYNCFIDAAPCLTADAKFFKDHLLEAIVTKCSKCTAKQSIALDKFADYYTKNAPEQWEALVAKAIDDAQKKSAT